MAYQLSSFLNKKVICMLVDGRTFIGTLIANDQTTNIVLQNCVERKIRPAEDEDGSSEEPLGMFMTRGDEVVLCGEVDEKLDNDIDWPRVHGQEIGTTKHV